MAPKKKEEEKKILLGRPGNSLKSGIVCRNTLFLMRVAFLLNSLLQGRPGQRGKINSISGNHKEFIGQPGCMSIF